jgi:Fe2+ transport system protein B
MYSFPEEERVTHHPLKERPDMILHMDANLERMLLLTPQLQETGLRVIWFSIIDEAEGWHPI